MPTTPDPRSHVWAFLIGITLFGGLIGTLVGPLFDPFQPFGPYPLPHHVPKYPGVASLRFAMVHDVVTERYPKHGLAYYEERNRRTQRALDEEKSRTSPRHFELIDDLAAGLDHLGKHAESIELMRDKLKRQTELGHTAMDLYSTHANLGTFIILWEIHEGLADTKKAKAGLEEGLKHIHQAIAINPRSHFGREIWQAVILEYLIALLDNPELVLKYDMAGNSLTLPREFLGHNSWTPKNWSPIARDAYLYLQKPAAEQSPEELARFRSHARRLYPDDGWAAAVKSSHKEGVPFDEPTLGIIGMWRVGGGPNPFFAVALAEIMLRVGQDHLAWNAFERAWLLAGTVGAEPIPMKFKSHCRSRQNGIESALPEAEVAQLRPSFEKHLSAGKAYQKAYQEYEARRIKEGASIDDEKFYDAFDKEQGSIASPVGDEDRFLREDFRPEPTFSVAWMLLGAGCFSLAGAGLVRFRDWCARS